MPVIQLDHKPSQLAPVMQEASPIAARHLCVDIETGDALPEDIDLAAQFVKAAHNIKDPEKVKENIEKKRESMREKAALMDAAPIGCVTWVTESQQAIFYHLGYPWKPGTKRLKAIKGFDGELICEKDERAMLLAQRRWLNARAVPASIIIGHNIYGFDLPKLRIAYVRLGIPMPLVLQPEARDVGVEVYDVMGKFTRYFSTEKAGEKYITLEEMEARLGLPTYKDRLSGAEVPGCMARGELKKVLTYNWIDAMSTYAGFRKMTGLSADQVE